MFLIYFSLFLYINISIKIVYIMQCNAFALFIYLFICIHTHTHMSILTLFVYIYIFILIYYSLWAYRYIYIYSLYVAILAFFISFTLPFKNCSVVQHYDNRYFQLIFSSYQIFSIDLSLLIDNNLKKYSFCESVVA